MTEVLNLRVMSPLGIKQPCHRVAYQIFCLSDIYIMIIIEAKLQL